ncbi:hypothetical protein EK21DRAFT_117728 [Setomelanomma holmii]|uniref:Zn(2)-C6 fungal-type domain-containing protein n=1 Tax=Setomelanomma holmii TaxID=210430 RepID=A0A9P4GZR7_9PLEO|nr:hypothetical protein EK21DRAFT_117728 [Setomelanomma holmii]
MPPDRSRTVNAQGRQKSCSECAKGKRKCDLGQPACGRCRKQQQSCTYPPQPQAGCEGGSVNLENNLHAPDMSMELEDIGNVTQPLEFSFPNLSDVSNAGPADFDLTAGITSLESLNQMLYSSPDYEDQLVLSRAYTHVEKAFSAAHIAPFAKSRVSWSIEQLKLAPKMMLEQNGTPWQHPMLYEEYMPRSLQDAYAACGLYVAKNGTNNDMVTRFIRDRVGELIAATLPQQASDLLARAHAFMLYQTMLVFGGDITLYSQADTLLPLMDEVANALLPFAAQQDDLTGSLPLYPSTAARTAWAAYIFRESLRRTVLSTFHFVTMCYLLRGQLESCRDHLVIGNRVTLSAHLWNARSAFDFALAWNNKRHFVVKELNFTEVLKEAQPEDIDIFSKMMMIGLQGEDDIRGWFYTRGSTL